MARRRSKQRRVYFTGDPNGLQPGDDVGNRLKKQAQRIPPDDIGNRKADDPELEIPPDDAGNRVEGMPTHELSGILWDLDPKKVGRRRRLKTSGPAVRVGRYVVGGVNPIIAGDSQRAQEAQEAEHRRRHDARQDPRPEQHKEAREGRPLEPHRDVREGRPEPRKDDEEGGRSRRRKKGRGGYEQVDGAQAGEVNERRAARFFDFDEDDRFHYTLKSSPEEKRKASEDCVQRVLDEAGRYGTVKATLVEDGDRPKVLVAIEDRGPAPDVPEERLGKNAAEPLFPLGSAALMSLNYLVNKIVNRYPDDRIRLAILPKDDEQAYLDALETHKKTRGERGPAGRGDRPERGDRGARGDRGDRGDREGHRRPDRAPNGASAPAAPALAVVEELEDVPAAPAAYVEPEEGAFAAEGYAEETGTYTPPSYDEDEVRPGYAVADVEAPDDVEDAEDDDVEAGEVDADAAQGYEDEDEDDDDDEADDDDDDDEEDEGPARRAKKAAATTRKKASKAPVKSGAKKAPAKAAGAKKAAPKSASKAAPAKKAAKKAPAKPASKAAPAKKAAKKAPAKKRTS